jgi:hypothetical protein
MAGVTWGEFVEKVYRAAEVQGIDRDTLDKVEVPRITCDPDEGVKVTIRKLKCDKDIRDPKQCPIYMIVS